MQKQDLISESTEVSVRLRTLCRHANIKTFEELINKPKSELMRMRNFGVRTIAEVEDIKYELSKQ